MVRSVLNGRVRSLLSQPLRTIRVGPKVVFVVIVNFQQSQMQVIALA